MSEESEYIKARLQDVLDGQGALAVKLDLVREEQVTQRAEISANQKTILEHSRLLVLGNGQKSLTVQVAEANTRLDDVENDVCSVKKGKNGDPAAVKKEKLKLWGTVATLVGLILSQLTIWVFGLPGK